MTKTYIDSEKKVIADLKKFYESFKRSFAKKFLGIDGAITHINNIDISNTSPLNFLKVYIREIIFGRNITYFNVNGCIQIFPKDDIYFHSRIFMSSSIVSVVERFIVLQKKLEDLESRKSNKIPVEHLTRNERLVIEIVNAKIEKRNVLIQEYIFKNKMKIENLLHKIRKLLIRKENHELRSWLRQQREEDV